MHTCPPAQGPQGQASGQEHSRGWVPAALCPPRSSLAHSRGLSALAPGAVPVPMFHQATLPEWSFTADRAEVRAERAVAWPADLCPRVLRGHSPCSAGRASKTAGTSGTSAAGRSPRRSGSCQGLWTHTGLWVGWRGPGEGCHARRPSRCGSMSSNVCGRVRLWPHGLCPPGASVCGILQARTLEGVAMLSSRGSIFPTQGSNPCLLHWQVGSLPLSHLGRHYPRSPEVKFLSLLCGMATIEPSFHLVHPDP